MIKYKVGDKIELNEVNKKAFGDTFMGGKKIETIVKIEESPIENNTKLWMANGYWINPERIQKVKDSWIYKGTKTGRFSSKKPNIEDIERKTK